MIVNKLLTRLIGWILILLVVVGCGGTSAVSETDLPPTNTPSPPTSTPVPPTNTPAPQPSKLNLFDNTIVDIFTLLDGPQITVGRAGQETIRNDPNTITLPLAPYIGNTRENLNFTLKYIPENEQYLLSLLTARYIPFSDIPLVYTEGVGFSGQGTVEYNGRKFNTTVTIMPGEKGYKWSIVILETEGVYSITYEFETTPK